LESGLFAEGLKGFDKKNSLAGRLLFPCLLARHENHFDKLCVRCALGRSDGLFVRVGSHPVVRMSQKLLDRLDVLAIRFHQGAERVSQRVPANLAGNPRRFRVPVSNALETTTQGSMVVCLSCVDWQTPTVGCEYAHRSFQFNRTSANSASRGIASGKLLFCKRVIFCVTIERVTFTSKASKLTSSHAFAAEKR
jgi:hypothetical protein